tara:strand:- start:6888 stop:7295 length:408 start_codon:yes stop_codon:yes gene_type:complete
MNSTQEYIEELIFQYGHSDCHDLTIALSELYETNIILFKTKKSGLPIHSAILINNEQTLDAYGLSNIDKTLNRYQKITQEYYKEDLDFSICDLDTVYIFNGEPVSDFDFIVEDFFTLLNFYNINIDHLLRKKILD